MAPVSLFTNFESTNQQSKEKQLMHCIPKSFCVVAKFHMLLFETNSQNLTE